MQSKLIDTLVDKICNDQHCIKAEVSPDKKGVDVSIDRDRVKTLLEEVFMKFPEISEMRITYEVMDKDEIMNLTTGSYNKILIARDTTLAEEYYWTGDKYELVMSRSISRYDVTEEASL